MEGGRGPGLGGGGLRGREGIGTFVIVSTILKR